MHTLIINPTRATRCLPLRANVVGVRTERVKGGLVAVTAALLAPGSMLPPCYVATPAPCAGDAALPRPSRDRFDGERGLHEIVLTAERGLHEIGLTASEVLGNGGARLTAGIRSLMAS